MTSFLKILMIIVILSSSTFGFLDFDIGTKSYDGNDSQFANSRNSPTSSRITDISTSVSVSGDQENYLRGMNHGAGFQPTIASETVDQNEGYSFFVNHTESYDNDQLISNYTTVTPPLLPDFNRYDEVDFDISAMTTKDSYTVTSNNDTSPNLSNNGYFAQAIFLPYNGTEVRIDSLSLKTFILDAPVGMTVEASIFSARERSGDNAIIPDVSIAAQNATFVTDAGTDQKEIFLSFPQNVTVSSSNTYVNNTGLFAFVVVTHNSGSAWLIGADSNNLSGLPSYFNDTGIETEDDWELQSSDMVLSYNASLIYQTEQIGTEIERQSDSNQYQVDEFGDLTITETQSSTIGYRVYHNTTIPNDLPVSFNVSYTLSAIEKILADVSYSLDPSSSSVTWTIMITNSFGHNDSRIRFLYIPTDFTITDFDDDGTPRNTIDTDYSITNGVINDTINLLTTIDTGTYTITASSTNEFSGLTLSEEVNRGAGFVSNHTAFMGNSSSSPGGEAVGDTIRASSSTASLDITNGLLNATLRDQDGDLITTALTYGDHSVEAIWADSISFTTALDPNLDTGVWSVQFRWSNGTHAGAIYTEFAIIPKVDLQFLTPTSDFNALEASSIRLDVGLFDHGHSGRWVNDGVNTDGTLDWDFGTPTLTYVALDGSSGLHNYSATIDLTLSVNAIQTNSQYILNATFTDGFYTIFTEITMTTYHRGDSNIAFTSASGNSDDFEYGVEDVTFNFTPLNISAGSSSFDSSGSATFTLQITNSSHTITLTETTDYSITGGSPTYAFTVPWTNTTFEKGSSNIFTLNWTITELRESPNILYISTSFSFTGIDTDSPIITLNPADDTITEQESSTYTLSWNAVDDFSSTYTITNTTGTPTNLVTDSAWTSGVQVDYTFSIELWEGTHTYQITFEDEDSLTTSDSVTITVEDQLVPARTSSPSNVSYAIANDTNTISWTFTDKHPNTYQLYINEVASGFSGSWMSGVAIDIDISGLANENNYNLTMVAIDDSGNERVSKAFISIDRNNPTLTQIPNLNTISYNIGETDNSISWQLFDDNPDNYSVLQNGSVYDSIEGSFTDSQLIIADIDGFAIGAYNFTIVVFDTFGNMLVDTTILIVTDATDPVLSNPEDFSFESGTSTTQTISWTATDDNPGTYVLYENEIQIDTGSWSNGVEVSVDVTNNAVGIYNYTIVIFDASLNQVSSEVFVTVVDTILPTISSPEDTRIFNNQTDYSISWDVTDLNPDNYFIYRNGTVVASTNWASGSISYILGSLELGVYNFTIVIFDLGDNTVQDEIFITVKDFTITETNEVDSLPITTTVLEGDIETVDGTWTTLISGNGIADANITVFANVVSVQGEESGMMYNEPEMFTSDGVGNYILTLDYTDFSIGIYEWVVLFQKDNHETKTFTIQVEVVSHEVEFNIQYDDDLTRGSEFVIYVTVTYSSSGNSLQLDELTSRSGAVVNVNVTLLIEYEDENGEIATLTREGLTDETGIALIRISGTETEGIINITGMFASIQNNPRFSSNQFSQSPERFPFVVAGELDAGDYFELIQEFISENLIFVIAGIFIFLFIAVMLTSRRRRNRARKAQITQEIETATEEVDALMSIQAIILKNTESGIPFYNATYEEEDDSIDLSLISSLTTAISTFLSELQSSAKGFETMEREGIQLVSHRGDLSDFIIISKKALPVFMYQQIQNAHQTIENKFSKLITNPAMIYEIPEEEINQMMRENNLKLDLKGLIDVDPKVIEKVKNKSDITRNVRNNLVYLIEYADIVREANLPITLTSLIDFLATKEISFETASRLILVAYANGILLDKGS